MKKIPFLFLLVILACNGDYKKQTENNVDNITDLKIEAVRKAIIYNYDFINNENLADSLTFNRFKALYSDDFVLGPSEGKPLMNKETILEEWRGLFKENKGEFKLIIDRIEVSGDLAYALYHYDERLTNIETGKIYFEVVQSAIAILKRDEQEKWKFDALRWN